MLMVLVPAGYSAVQAKVWTGRHRELDNTSRDMRRAFPEGLVWLWHSRHSEPVAVHGMDAVKAK
jgi:hypothetical protein